MRSGAGRWWALGAGVVLALLAPRGVEGQTLCEVNNQATCGVQDPTMTITLTISRAARLSVGGTTLALPVPSALGVEGAPGLPAVYPVTVQSNTNWTLGLQSTGTLWTGTPIVTARQNKPATDLQWNNPAVNGTFTNVSPTTTGIASGAATAGTVVNLNLRVRYSFLLDRPGTYTLPLQLLLTAP
jgi:hypothetical protein